MSSNLYFAGVSFEAITAWAELSNGTSFDPLKHEVAFEENLAAVIDGELLLTPGGNRGFSNSLEWIESLRQIKATAKRLVLVISEHVTEREFGQTHAPDTSVDVVSDLEEHTASPAISVNQEILPEVAAGVETVSTSEIKEDEPVVEVPWETTPPPAQNDQLRASIAAIPSYYSSLKEPLNRLVDLGAGENVINTVLTLAGKPYHLGKIADFAQQITSRLGTSMDHMDLIQEAHTASVVTTCETPAEDQIMLEVMELIPQNSKAAVRSRFEEQVKKGLNKYWGEAWAQVTAARDAGRANTPVNLFFHIVKEMDSNTALAEKRGAAKIESFNDCRWIMEYLPKTLVSYEDHPNFLRGSRKYYLPRMKDAIERAGHIPLIWLFSIVVDNDYPTRALAGAAEVMISKYPALARIVTREQFDYAMGLVVKTFTARAKDADYSWKMKYDQPHIGASLYHHAVFAGKCYLEIFRSYAEQGLKFMDNTNKEALLEVLCNLETMALLERWYMNQNPWKHGVSEGAAYEHFKQEQEHEERIRAYEERRQAELGERDPSPSFLPVQ